jgi:hypothetical protein
VQEATTRRAFIIVPFVINEIHFTGIKDIAIRFKKNPIEDKKLNLGVWEEYIIGLVLTLS